MYLCDRVSFSFAFIRMDTAEPFPHVAWLEPAPEDPEFLTGNTITAAEVKKGRDIQGIPWPAQSARREDFRVKRVTSLLRSRTQPPLENATHTQSDALIYDFHRFSRNINCSISHFQLRNLLWAPNKSEIYFIRESSLVRWHPTRQTATSVLDWMSPNSNEPTLISTLFSDGDFVYAGGMASEFVAVDCKTKKVAVNRKLSNEENSITNAISDFYSPSGVNYIIASNNDKKIRFLSKETFEAVKTFTLNTAVNYAVSSPDGKLIICCCDEESVCIIDSDTGEVVTTLNGHKDYSFAASFHPSGLCVATGNQDCSTRVWDLRFPSRCSHILPSMCSPIRSLRFSPDGSTLIASENSDFVHIYDIDSDYESRQLIDFFGEIPGIAITPDCESLFASVLERSYGGILELSRVRESFDALLL